MRTHPSSPHQAAPVAGGALRRRRLGAAATVATLALGSALAGAAGTAAHVVDAPAAAASGGAPATDGGPSLAVSLSVHSEDHRARLADGGARLERVRTVRFAWRSR